VAQADVEIRRLRPDDVDAVVELSLRAWTPVFASLREALGDEIFLRLSPDWERSQSEAIRSSCLGEDSTFVAVADGRPVGFATVSLNVFHKGMGAIDMIAVDPAYQRRSIGSQLTSFASDYMRDEGMDIALVETGGDPGHAPARATYDAAGFTLLPIARYFRLLR
jgi:ribosomal protein S18 acetylase RimI-like enzyme